MSQALNGDATTALERAAETDGAAQAERVLASLASAATAGARDAVLDDQAELADAMAFMLSCGVTRVALQMPDGMLCLASRLVDRASALALAAGRPDVDVVVLGDTSFGSDMVDEVAARHYDPSAAAANSRGLAAAAGDAAGAAGDETARDTAAPRIGIVHLGPATLVASSALPVFFALGRAPADPAAAASAAAAAVRSVAPPAPAGGGEGGGGEAEAGGRRTVWLSADSDLLHAAGAVASRLRAELGPSWRVVEPPVARSFAPASPGEAAASSGEAPREASAAASAILSAEGGSPGEGAGVVAHLGVGGEGLRRLSLALGGPPAFLVGPSGAGGPGAPAGWAPAAGVGGRALTRHFLHAQRARLSSSVALVAGTMAARGFLPLLRGLGRLVRSTGRRCTTLLVGKLAPSKLANFDGVDVFVVVGAGDAALLGPAAQKEFPAPVLSAHELLMGLLPDEVPWEGRLCTDVGELLALLRGARPGCLEDGGAAGPAGGTGPAGGGGSAGGTGSAGPDDDSDAPFFSPLTGRFHAREGAPGAAGSESLAEDGASGRLVPLAERSLAVPGTAAAVLASREWRGLEAALPADVVEGVVPGWHGVASTFSHERERRGGGE